MTSSNPQLHAILTDRYRIERQIGQGGMATVYLAEDLKLERQVALKVLRPELGAVLGTERFLAEVKITARLDHPHILTLIDSGVAGGLLYYVLPYVRGESLRDLLDREHQLSIEQALTITKHIASALDYAHRQGVVHRDIKPENILLQEGEAMLADFGIALAVQEAGGNRLTETGLSLGTPQYMSPEQATGDRTVDSRSDVYSLAAVLYEMLVGDPPLTGKNVQAVIAKLLTEQPTRIRIVRNTVPEGIDRAVFKALSKVPADRYTSAGDFARALESAQSVANSGATHSTVPRSRTRTIAAVMAGIVVVGGAAIAMKNSNGRNLNASAALRDRTQLTFTGKTSTPALSADGKQLAYFIKECKGADCRYAIEVQDVGSTTTHRVLDKATAGYNLEWSPDRRNLMMNGTIDGRSGNYVVSALGGAPRWVTTGAATFFAGGDSLLLGAPGPSDSGFVVRFAGLGGGVRDSVRIPGVGQVLATLLAVPGTARFVALIVQSPGGLWQVFERNGKVTDQLHNSCTCGGVASQDAIWMTRAGPTAAEAVVRVALDSSSGKFATHQDTIYSGQFTGVSVTADGTQMAVDDGSYAHSVVATTLPELLQGKLPAGAPLIQASNTVSASVSPDGARLLARRTVPAAKGVDEVRLSVMPFAGGPEQPLIVTGSPYLTYWADSVTVVASTLTPAGTRLTALDVRTGAAGSTITLPDSGRVRSTLLRNGWAWITSRHDKIIVDQNGRRHEIAMPKWFTSLSSLEASADGSRLAVIGWGSATSDTLRVDVVPTAGGASAPWFRSFGEQGTVRWLADGSVAATIWSGPEAVSLFKLTGPDQVQRLGAIPHVATQFDYSADLKRVTMGWAEYRGDAWMYRVVKP